MRYKQFYPKNRPGIRGFSSRDRGHGRTTKMIDEDPSSSTNLHLQASADAFESDDEEKKRDDDDDVIVLSDGSDDDEVEVETMRKKRKKKRGAKKKKRADVSVEEDGFYESTKRKRKKREVTNSEAAKIARASFGSLFQAIGGKSSTKEDTNVETKTKKKNRRKYGSKRGSIQISARSNKSDDPEVIELSSDDDDDTKNGHEDPPRPKKRPRVDEELTDDDLEIQDVHDLTQDGSDMEIKLSESTKDFLNSEKKQWVCEICGPDAGKSSSCEECKWKCPSCTSMNAGDTSMCHICDEFRPDRSKKVKTGIKRKTKSAFDEARDEDKLQVEIKGVALSDNNATSIMKKTMELNLILDLERQSLQFQNFLGKMRLVDIQLDCIGGYAFSKNNSCLAFLVSKDEYAIQDNFSKKFQMRSEIICGSTYLIVSLGPDQVYKLKQILQKCSKKSYAIRNWKELIYNTAFDRIFGQSDIPVDTLPWPQTPVRRRATKTVNDEFVPIQTTAEGVQVAAIFRQPRRRSSRLRNKGVRSRRRRKPVQHLLSYPMKENAKDVVTLNTGDLERLDEGVFFNDNLIDFYTRYMREEIWSAEVKSRIHVFSCHFYEKLTEKSETFDSKRSINYENVRTWTKDFNIFQKDYVIIPINGSAHWSLMIVHFKFAEMERRKLLKTKTTKKKDDDDDDDDDITGFTLEEEKLKILKGTENYFLHMDSLKLHNSSRIVKRLRSYFNMEWNRVNGESSSSKSEEESKKVEEKSSNEDTKKSEEDESEEKMRNKFSTANLPFKKALGKKVPQQKNGCDCGVYTAKFIERFVRGLISEENDLNTQPSNAHSNIT